MLFSTALLSGTTACLSLESAISPRSSCSFDWKVTLETTIWELLSLLLVSVCFGGPFSWPGTEACWRWFLCVLIRTHSTCHHCSCEATRLRLLPTGTRAILPSCPGLSAQRGAWLPTCPLLRGCSIPVLTCGGVGPYTPGNGFIK